MTDASAAFSDRLNAALRSRRGRQVDLSHISADTINRFIRGQCLVEPDAELDRLLELKGSDTVAYYRLPADVRDRVDTYVAARPPQDAA